jgi:hypothetical protein
VSDKSADAPVHDEGGGSHIQWLAIAVLLLCWLAEAVLI